MKTCDTFRTEVEVLSMTFILILLLDTRYLGLFWVSRPVVFEWGRDGKNAFENILKVEG